MWAKAAVKAPSTLRVPLQDELARIGAHRQLVFRYHVVGCGQLRGPDLLEAAYVTTLSGHPLRFSEKEVSQAPRTGRSQTRDSPAFELPPLRAWARPHTCKSLSLPRALRSALDPAHCHAPVLGPSASRPCVGPHAPSRRRPLLFPCGKTAFCLIPPTCLKVCPTKARSLPQAPPTALEPPIAFIQFWPRP